MYDGEGKTIVAPAIPDDWKDYSFKLRSINGLVITVEVKNGVISEVLAEAYRDTDTELYLKDKLITKISLKKGESKLLEF